MSKKYLPGGILALILFCFMFNMFNMYSKCEIKQKNDEISYLMETHVRNIINQIDENIENQDNITCLYNTEYVKNMYYFDSYAKISSNENWYMIAKGLVHFAEKKNFEKLALDDIKNIRDFLNWALNAKLPPTKRIEQVDEFYNFLHAIYYEKEIEFT